VKSQSLHVHVLHVHDNFFFFLRSTLAMDDITLPIVDHATFLSMSGMTTDTTLPSTTDATLVSMSGCSNEGATDDAMIPDEDVPEKIVVELCDGTLEDTGCCVKRATDIRNEDVREDEEEDDEEDEEDEEEASESEGKTLNMFKPLLYT